MCPRWNMLNGIHPLAVPDIVHVASFLEKLITSRIRPMLWVFRNKGMARMIRSCGAGYLAEKFRVLKRLPHLPGKSMFLYNFGPDAMKRVKDERFPARLRRCQIIFGH